MSHHVASLFIYILLYDYKNKDEKDTETVAKENNESMDNDDDNDGGGDKDKKSKEKKNAADDDENPQPEQPDDSFQRHDFDRQPDLWGRGIDERPPRGLRELSLHARRDRAQAELRPRAGGACGPLVQRGLDRPAALLGRRSEAGAAHLREERANSRPQVRQL